MTAPARPRRLRLFTDADRGTDLHEWRRHGATDAEGRRLDVAVNDKGWGLVHAISQKADESRWLDQYDQFVLFESPGALVVCVDDAGRVGLVENWRCVGPRPPGLIELCRDPVTGKLELKRYIERIRIDGRFAALVDALGRYVWQCPGGLAPAVGFDDLRGFVNAVAAIEAKEESGFEIADAEIVGEVNSNPTFFAHSQYVVRARIVGRGSNQPEDFETIGKVKLFAPKELRAMVASGELFDAMTISALVVAGVAF